MKSTSLSVLYFILALALISCKKDDAITNQNLTNEVISGASGTTTGMKFGKMIDIDGNVYKTIQIGKQIWMAENLRVSRYRNGDRLINTNGINGSYFYYNNDSAAYNSTYGKIYDWRAVVDSRGLAPKGWHIPQDYEWEYLINYLGGPMIAGKKLKSTSGWYSSGNGTNEVGFNALPGGLLLDFPYYERIGEIGIWWSKTNVWYDQPSRLLFWDLDVITLDFARNAYIRCIKD